MTSVHFVVTPLQCEFTFQAFKAQALSLSWGSASGSWTIDSAELQHCWNCTVWRWLQVLQGGFSVRKIPKNDSPDAISGVDTFTSHPAYAWVNTFKAESKVKALHTCHEAFSNLHPEEMDGNLLQGWSVNFTGLKCELRWGKLWSWILQETHDW